MNTELTDEQVAAYRRDGFLVVRQFLSRAERDELLAGVEQEASWQRRIVGCAETAARVADGIEVMPVREFLKRLWNGAIIAPEPAARAGIRDRRLRRCRQRVLCGNVQPRKDIWPILQFLGASA